MDVCKNAGLTVLALSSDMGNENRALWTSLGIQIKKEGIRNNYFVFNNNPVFVVPDVCHLLKNLKTSTLNNIIYLSNEYCESQGLEFNVVDGSIVKDLWNSYVGNGVPLHSLQHLKEEDLFPNNFQKMNVASSCRFFRYSTAAAIELEVKSGNLPSSALTTAHFIRLMCDWFALTSCKERKASITLRNKDKYDLLEKIIDVFENTEFDKGWKPLNVGIIMSSPSIMGVSEFLFLNGYDFFLFHRLSQDALENVF